MGLQFSRNVCIYIYSNAGHYNALATRLKSNMFINEKIICIPIRTGPYSHMGAILLSFVLTLFILYLSEAVKMRSFFARFGSKNLLFFCRALSVSKC